MRRWLPLLLIVGACQCDESPRGGGGTHDAGVKRDTGPASDASGTDLGDDDDASTADAGRDGGSDSGIGVDGGGPGDGGLGDSGVEADAEIEADSGFDSGTFFDSGEPLDSGVPFDSGAFDSGVPFDSGAPFDSGIPFDSGVVADSGAPDSGVAPDSGAPDSGIIPGSGDLWIEINYFSAFSPQSPSWSYSVSPGWGPIDWDFLGGGSGAEAWDRFNNMSVGPDPIGGSVLEIGGSSELQLMFGLVPLISYTTATVEVEGRSLACCSGVTFDVFNPATGCGISGATMSQDWTADIVVMDLTGCFTPGDDLQAVRVDPTNGSVALRRMRLTFTGASW